MQPEDNFSIGRDIMIEFADQTGLSPPGNMLKRYLWTDSFAVCNFLELYGQTSDETYSQLALQLVEQVHMVLGRHREDDARSGWISGLGEQEGKEHPTKGGLRIGKDMNERRPEDPFDQRLEWDRDGQYYHYLTKWMHALDRVSRVTGEPTYSRWAMELAKTAHDRFTYAPSTGGQKRMYWKMSIDLSYPLVHSMGHHDPLDGFITYAQLQDTANRAFQKAPPCDLRAEIADMARICRGKTWATDDTLGIGGLLSDAHRVAQLMSTGSLKETGLLGSILGHALSGLKSVDRNNPMNLPADYRLAFRELGLSIGLKALKRLETLTEEHPAVFEKESLVHSQIETLLSYARLGDAIEGFWLDRDNQRASSWMEHRDINMVMLATSLTPDGYLAL